MDASTAASRRTHAGRRGARQVARRLLRADQAEGPVAAAVHDGHDDGVAGDPSVALIALTCLGGYLSAGGAGAVNHYCDRDIDAQMRAHRRRGRSRRGASRPRAALRFGIALAVAVVRAAVADASTCWPRRWRSAGFVGYVGVYTMWLKRRTPQNIVIGGAAGAVPPLVGWAAITRLAVLDRGLPVRDRLLLDAAALLGAQPADEGRVREGRRADAAGGPRRARDAPPDRALHAAAVRGHASCRSAPACSAASTWSPRWCSGWRSSAAPCCCTGAPTAARALRLYLFSLLYLALLFGAMVADVKL